MPMIKLQQTVISNAKNELFKEFGVCYDDNFSHGSLFSKKNNT